MNIQTGQLHIHITHEPDAFVRRVWLYSEAGPFENMIINEPLPSFQTVQDRKNEFDYFLRLQSLNKTQ